MPDKFLSPEGDLEKIFVTDYEMIDQFAATGSLWVWGDNWAGQLADNTVVRKSSPVQTVSGGTNWKQVSCNSASVAAIKTDGTLWLWGSNSNGLLGDNTTTSKSSPVQTISGGTNWKQVSRGWRHTAAVKTDGTLWIWGHNSSPNNGTATGQLGDNTTTDKSSPIQTVAGGTNWKQVSCGGAHTAAIKTNGTLWTWGRNTSGELGDNTVANKSSPVQTVAGGTNWKQVSCSGGGSNTAAIKTDGTLWLWGDNSEGQLGDNTRISKSSPVQTISGGTNWKQVSSSWMTAAIKTDGTLWVWGGNWYGQLGDGTTTAKSSPIQTISGGTNWKQVFCGDVETTVAIKTDGTLWGWGGNYYGGLGDNNAYLYSTSPIQTVAGGNNWKQVSCGSYTTVAIYFYDAGNLYPNS